MSSVVEQLTEVTPAEARAAKAEAVMRAAGLEPLEPYPGSSKPWRCRCSRCGETITPRYNDVQQGQGGCRACGRRDSAAKRRLVGAEAVMRAAGLEPLEPYPGTDKPWRCRCSSCGETVTPRHSGVVQGRGGCRPCGSAINAARWRMESAADAEARMRAAGLEPLEPYPGTMHPWRCRCSSCGKTVSPLHNTVQQGRGGCLDCGRIKQGHRRKGAAAADAVAVMRAAGLEPLEPYPGSAKPWRCRCSSCGETVTPRHSTVNQRRSDKQSNRSACSQCGNHGFQTDKSGYVYLLKSETFRAYKLGISNIPDRRIGKHCSYDDQRWEVCLLLRFSDGAAARSLEQQVIKSWRAAGWAEAVPADLMPQSGYTETVAMVDAGPVSAVLDQLGAALAD